MLAKALANESKARFFAISTSSLTSKWFGESEKLVRTLFALARHLQPSVIFIDEVDAVLSSRGGNEMEASRRLKTEFLVQFDGVATSGDSQVVVLAATNRPQDLDEAARRRFVKRVYIPLPDAVARKALLQHLLDRHGKHHVSTSQMNSLVRKTDGYSCSDLSALAKEAAMFALRDYTPAQLQRVDKNDVRGITVDDFWQAMKTIRSSVAPQDVEEVEQWAAQFGSSGQ